VRLGHFLASALALYAVAMVPASAVEVSTKGGITVTSEDGRFSTRIGGRLQLDAACYNEDQTPLESGTELRRGRLFLQGLVFGDWEYKLETEFAEDQPDITDAYLKHKPSGLVFGQFKIPFAIEQLTSSRFISFMERSVDGLREGRRLGAGWFRNGDAWTFGSAIFGQSIDDKTVGDEGMGAAIRGVYRPWQTADGNLIHVGISSFFQEPADGRKESRVRQRPWSHVTDVRFVDTGIVDNVSKERGVNLEFTSVYDSFSLQAEYIGVELSRDTGLATEKFDAWYLYGTWMSKGSKRSYDKTTGAFDRSKVENGTWELGLRYSVIDLQSTTIRGGKQDGLTVAANYYLNPRLRFMFNILIADTSNSEITLGGEQERIDALQMRVSFDF